MTQRRAHHDTAGLSPWFNSPQPRTPPTYGPGGDFACRYRWGTHEHTTNKSCETPPAPGPPGEQPIALTVCTRCPTLHPGPGMCPNCQAASDKQRRPHGSPYGTQAHRSFRETVLAHQPICTLCHVAPSNVADHYPTERRDLIDQGLNPNDPQYGRGLCKPCHDRHTARATPGGWNQRDTP